MDLNPRDHGSGLREFQSRSFGQLGQLSMAPQVGFEPTTDRLTADCSTTELLWNVYDLSTFKLVNYFITHVWPRPTLAEKTSQLPSALRSLTSVFGMGIGVTSSLSLPDM